MKNFDFSLRIGPSCSFFSCYLKYWSVIVIEFQSHNFSEILVSECAVVEWELTFLLQKELVLKVVLAYIILCAYLGYL